MSADSPTGTRFHPTPKKPTVVHPQQVPDPSILESVAGFITEVVPSTNHTDSIDPKDKIQWVKFEQIDDESYYRNTDTDSSIPAPLIIVLGYSSGLQLWAVQANGEATEILSWRHGSIRSVKILPTPAVVGKEIEDKFAYARPLIALCDSVILPGSAYYPVRFLSLKTAEQVEITKFRNLPLEVLANKRSVVVTFEGRLVIFDAFILQPIYSLQDCFIPSGLQQNPIALGSRWMAYAPLKLDSSLKSNGGFEGEGVQSYTATVLHAAKTLGRGLRDLKDSVASTLNMNASKSGTSSPQAGGQADVSNKGVVTVLDLAQHLPSADCSVSNQVTPCTVAHFPAHRNPLAHMAWDPSGCLLLTADVEGHYFHLFRLQPHPGGPSLAAVHHLYVLYRGDTSARVQDMCFSGDGRWVGASTIRGTTHVFAVTAYGGGIGVRTHTTPFVVNKMSRFHRSAGLTAEGRSSPVTVGEASTNGGHPAYCNPRHPPYPTPTVVHPLNQIRQSVQGHVPAANLPAMTLGGLHKLSGSGSSTEDNHLSLRLAATFAPPRAWLERKLGPRDAPQAVGKQALRPCEAVFVITVHGHLMEYELDPRHISSVPKERVCDDTSIELHVTKKAQWLLQRKPDSVEVPLPMPARSLALLAPSLACSGVVEKRSTPDTNEEQWLSQVEIVTHAGPHRRLWMGPQFEFKTYEVANGTTESYPIDVGRSKPVNMPVSKTQKLTMIESCSIGSCGQSPHRGDNREQFGGSGGDYKLREDLADAMQEPGCRVDRAGGRCVIVSVKQPPPVAKVVNPLGGVVTVQSDDEQPSDQPDEVIVMHENCDEALFRPIVSVKPTPADNRHKYHPGNEIIVRPLHSTAEVAVKLLEKSPIGERKSSSSADKEVKVEEKSVRNGKKQSAFSKVTPKIKNTSNEKESKYIKPKPVISSFSDESREKSDPLKDLLGDLYDSRSSAILNNDEKIPEEPATKYPEDFIPSIDDSVRSSESTHESEKSLNFKYQGLNLSEIDQSSTRKRLQPRIPKTKPKPKLGVRLNQKTEYQVIKHEDDVWVIEDDSENNKSNDGDLLGDDIDTIIPYSSPENVPKKSYSSCVKNTDQLIEAATEDELVFDSDVKVSDKSSDDEKNSGLETTESDDSGKVNLTLVDLSQDEEVKEVEVKKAGRKKSRKKHK